MLIRQIDGQIKGHFKKYKEILILFGSRQVGKTTLLKRLFPEALYLLVDNEPVKKALETYDINTYKQIIGRERDLVVIDEIHLLADPGRAAKIIYDQLPVKLIITGSSSFYIKKRALESLAGRKIDYFLYPLTFSEYLFQTGIEKKLDFTIFNNLVKAKELIPKTHLYDLPAILNNVLIYGLYPNLVNHPLDKQYLLNFADSLIFRDILELNLIENRRIALNLLKLLAYQVGSLISYSELAARLGIDQRTVRRYLEIFEQSFLIYRLYPYSKRDRDEIVKSPKIYFYDTGLRNALIEDFSEINLRPDKGSLFENFIINEFLKANIYNGSSFKLNYWRTKQGSEVDLVLSKGKELIGVEIKFGQEAANKAFINRYPEAKVKTINCFNFY